MTTRSIINIDVQGQITCKMLCFIVDKTPYLFIFFSMFEPILYKTGPDCGCAPRFFFITKDVSNIFSNNIEGRLNCKREFVVDPALTHPLNLSHCL